jgi:hypothetical protein
MPRFASILQRKRALSHCSDLAWSAALPRRYRRRADHCSNGSSRSCARVGVLRLNHVKIICFQRHEKSLPRLYHVIFCALAMTPRGVTTMATETLFHLIMGSMIGACVLGCIVAAFAEMYNASNYRVRRLRKNMHRARRARHAARYR